MGKVKRFEDLEAWKKARELTDATHEICSREPFRKNYVLRDQIRRASISVMANVSEGFERDGDKEFIQFLAIAKGSCGEVRSHLYVALDQGYITQVEFDEISEKSEKTSKIIYGLMKYLRQTSMKGKKFK